MSWPGAALAPLGAPEGGDPAPVLRVEGTEGPCSENLGFWVWLHNSWLCDLEKERDLAEPQFPSVSCMLWRVLGG